MSVAYIKTFNVNGTILGIEDHKDGKPASDHFFPDKYKSGESKRFHLWYGGCGFGQADTLDEAEKLMKEYIKKQINAEVSRHKNRLKTWKEIQKKFVKYGINKFGN